MEQMLNGIIAREASSYALLDARRVHSNRRTIYERDGQVMDDVITRTHNKRDTTREG